VIACLIGHEWSGPNDIFQVRAQSPYSFERTWPTLHGPRPGESTGPKPDDWRIGALEYILSVLNCGNINIKHHCRCRWPTRFDPTVAMHRGVRTIPHNPSWAARAGVHRVTPAAGDSSLPSSSARASLPHALQHRRDAPSLPTTMNQTLRCQHRPNCPLAATPCRGCSWCVRRNAALRKLHLEAEIGGTRRGGGVDEWEQGECETEDEKKVGARSRIRGKTCDLSRGIKVVYQCFIVSFRTDFHVNLHNLIYTLFITIRGYGSSDQSILFS
jgi:hypothetical protein